MVLLLGIALAVAQLANFGLILNERQKLSLAQNDGPAITRFAGAVADVLEADPVFREALVADLSHRGARYRLSTDSGIAEAERSDRVESRLAENLRTLGHDAVDVRAADARQTSAKGGSSRQAGRLVLEFAAKLPNGQWLTGFLPTPRRTDGRYSLGPMRDR